MSTIDLLSDEDAIALARAIAAGTRAHIEERRAKAEPITALANMAEAIEDLCGRLEARTIMSALIVTKLTEELRWLRQTVHRAHHEGPLEGCPKATCQPMPLASPAAEAKP